MSTTFDSFSIRNIREPLQGMGDVTRLAGQDCDLALRGMSGRICAAVNLRNGWS
jgi:hypothetical protein